jgi:arylsulfatase A-like enzyme
MSTPDAKLHGDMSMPHPRHSRAGRIEHTLLRRHRASLLLLAAALVHLAGCARVSQPPNVLLVVIDTVRRDHLSCYGHARNTSPVIDALAAESVRFDRAYATAPWTSPSVASMITGRYPSSHGVTRVGPLPDEVVTLAEILRGEGYATAGFVSNFLVGRQFNFDQGYDAFRSTKARDPRELHEAITSSTITGWGQDALRRFAESKRPFFLFVHYFDPHYNYKRHAEYGYAGDGEGRLDGTQTIERLREMSGDMTPQEIAFIQDLYDEEIRHTDAAIGHLLDTLEELGLHDNTLIALTADHGEEFLDHGWIGHTRTLYEELIHVPLIIREPGGRKGPPVVDEFVSLAALSPTILDLIGVGVSSAKFQAGSIAPLLASEDARGPAAVFAEVDFVPVLAHLAYKTAHKKTIVTARYKIILDEKTDNVELYDISLDPNEQNDLAPGQPELVQHLLPLLDSYISAAGSDAEETIDMPLSEEDLKRLRSLGYIGK